MRARRIPLQWLAPGIDQFESLAWRQAIRVEAGQSIEQRMRRAGKQVTLQRLRFMRLARLATTALIHFLLLQLCQLFACPMDDLLRYAGQLSDLQAVALAGGSFFH